MLYFSRFASQKSIQNREKFWVKSFLSTKFVYFRTQREGASYWVYTVGMGRSDSWDPPTIPDPDMLNINPLVLFFTDGMRVGDGIKFSISQGIQEEQPALKYHDADVSGIIFYFCLFNPQRMLCSDVVLMKKVE